MKVMVVYSGGLDSTSLLFDLRAGGHEVQAVSVDYGQRHSKELRVAALICRESNITHHLVSLPGLGSHLGGSSQTDCNVPVPEGHYSAENMKATVVPNRNMILLAVAGGVAIAQKCDALAYAAHAGDHAIYPDCREPFAKAMSQAFKECDYTPLAFLRPYLECTKAQVVTRGFKSQAPLAMTWSCYKGDKLHCGRCGTCVERREAFVLAQFPDPTVYDPAAPSLADMLAKGPREARGLA